MARPPLDVLDTSGSTPHDMAAAACERFDALAPGSGFVLAATQDPAAVRSALQRRALETLEWWPLERGPDRWRIHIAKAEGDPAGPRTLTNLMCADHKRLDSLYGVLYKALEANDLETARGCLADFQVGIERHVVQEEDILMPIMAERGGDRGPRDSDQMHEEHERILGELETAVAAVRDAQPNASQTALAALTQMRFVLEGHNQNEERLLYPISDRETAADERAGVIARIQAL